VDNNDRKSNQLGEPLGTANAKLRKLILFWLVTESGKNYCIRCNGLIASVDDLSIDHKEPWLHSEAPRKLFYDLSNIGFSHYHCNIRLARRNRKYATEEERRQANKRMRHERHKRTFIYDPVKRRERYLRTGK
jgi:hypothetical protein